MTGPSTRARPFDTASGDAIIASMRLGNYLETACRLSGRDPRVVRRWVERGVAESLRRDLGDAPNESLDDLVAFARGMLKAEAEAESSMVERIRDGADEDWRAAGHILERRHPKRWGKHVNVTLRAELESAVDRLARVFEDEPEILERAIGALAGGDEDG